MTADLIARLEAALDAARIDIAERANSPHPNLSEKEVQYAIGRVHGFDQAAAVVRALSKEAEHG